tara:strand:- start:21509 stop:22276 length:768 start_codon:yes stop_codon:yes gene_type:complete
MKRTVSLSIIIGLLAFGCGKSKTSKKSNNVSTTSPVNSVPVSGSPTTGSGSGSTSCVNGSADDAGVATAGQVIEYYKINNPPVVAHGAGSGTVVWSSETDLPQSYSQNMFSTNAKFNVRVVPRRQFYGTDSKGVSCNFAPLGYTKLQVGVVLRRREDPSGVGQYKVLESDVDCPSQTHEFQVPSNTAFPFVVEIKDVKWDYSCIDYANQGYSQADLEAIGYYVCPWDQVWVNDCYSLEVQFATDTTKDLPGPRTN